VPGRGVSHPQQGPHTVKIKDDTFPKPPKPPWITADEVPGTVLFNKMSQHWLLLKGLGMCVIMTEMATNGLL
jgi:hypothetical protein